MRAFTITSGPRRGHSFRRASTDQRTWGVTQSADAFKGASSVDTGAGYRKARQNPNIVIHAHIAMMNANPPQKPAPKKRNPWPLRVLILIGGLLILMLMCGLLFRKPILRFFIEREAKARGFEIEFDEFDFEFGRVDIERVRFSPIGFSGIKGTLERAAITWEGFWIGDVRKIEARSMGLQALGSAADIAIFLSEWGRAYPRAFEAEISAKPITFTWREDEKSAPWLVISGGVLSPAAGGTDFVAESAVLSGVSVGAVGARWQSERGSISLGFGKNSISDAPVLISIEPKKRPAIATLSLKPSTMADLGNPLGLKLPTEKAQLGGTAKLLLPDTIVMPGQGALKVELDMSLRGYVPPHPKELNRIIFGDTTSFSATLELGANRKSIVISNAQMKAGAFGLKGGGKIERKGVFATIEMKMDGAVRCVDMAQSAVSSHLGNAAGTIVGDMAKNSLKGAMNISLRIEADTRDLGAAKVQQQVSGSCGISIPLPSIPSVKLPELGELPPIPKL